MTPARLVDEIRRGSQEAENILYKRYFPGLLVMLLARTQDHARAEDIAQDTMITVIKRLRTSGIDQPDTLHRYIQQTGKFLHIGWMRKRINNTEFRESVDEFEHKSESIEDTLVKSQVREFVRQIIKELTVPRDREILHRHYVLEQAKPVICEALELTAGHFDRVINRARDRFKKLYAERSHDF